MDPFHERLARVGLGAAGRYGFALAGGYAVQAAGLLERPSEDVDLFTAWDRRDEFGSAVTAVIQAYRDEGVTVDVERRYDTFARLMVTDNSHTAKVELGVDWRANDPILMSIGPVLHPDDAVANKMSALYGRAFARDFIDIDAAMRSGKYSGEDLLWLAERADSGFERHIFAGALGQADLLDQADFAQYGIAGRELDEMRSRFARWRRDLLAENPPQ
ncbi:nucleotidyl transferase AbiEii/AbiGii toxin family protein [Actinoplanes awajinensis]|uniref:Nucleotidyl transferase AbiEii toxin, Type IV TA system n=1 Tax=Actinoplanes awajinensis subsp. mycoplanecinus TaxID=135947 RepID=A0A101JGP4_9ACTN|nr:nucleotidyl transferase AbiEii/AbiGii toxin family protein [Actinoplanes awajinensis]KUL26569.1 hypothetical protein ADL15_38230 [Actinoplanes awajinensis subsp. mycoplanecinus]